jgi:type II secretory pathway predicted ATPase ExeA
MYQQHFGFRRALFERPIAGEGDVFLGARLRAIAENIEIATTTRDSVLVLYGAAGLGKTTLAAHVLRSVSTRLAMGWLAAEPQTTHDLLELLLGEFGFDARGLSRAERLHGWREYLRELGATNTRAFIGVENAQELRTPVLQALESLTRADPNGGPGANVVLMGTSALVRRLDEDTALAHLMQRVRLRQRFAPFDAAETEAYVVHEVMAAGGDYDKVFAAGAAGAVHRYSRGVPRLINNLCETALQVAARRHAPLVTPELVAATAIDCCGLAPPAALREETIEAREAAVELPEDDLFYGDAGPGEDIPTLTESVEIDFESGAYNVVVNGDAAP